MNFASDSGQRRGVGSRTWIIVLAVLSMLAVGVTLVGTEYAADAQVASGDTVCFTIDEGAGNDGTDQHLNRVDFDAAGNVSAVTTVAEILTPQGNIENIAIDNETGDIYAYNPFTNTMFVYDGSDGSIISSSAAGLGDVDAMTWVLDVDGDVNNNQLWVSIDPGDEIQPIIQQITPAGVEIAPDPGPSIQIPTSDKVDGLAWVPATNTVYIAYGPTAVGNVPSTLAILDPGTGAITPIGAGTGNMGVADIEGLGVDGDGQLVATTGEDGVNANQFFYVDAGTGEATLGADLAGPTGFADFESVDCAFPAIGLAKAVTDVTAVGEDYEVTYTFTVENFGNLPLDNITLTDDYSLTYPAPASASAPVVTDNCTGILLIDAVCTILHTVTVSDWEADVVYDNNASVRGDTPYAATPGDPDNSVTDNSVDGLNPDPNDDDNPEEESPTPVTFADPPLLVVAKTVVNEGVACPADFAAATLGAGDPVEVSLGEQVTFCINIINNGASDAIVTSVTDPQAPGGAVAVTPTTIVPTGEAAGSYPLTVTADTEVENVVTVAYTDPDDNPQTPVTDPSLIAPRGLPVLEILKSVVPVADDCPVPGVDGVGTALPVSIGDTVKYCITVTNTGDDVASSIEISDPQAPAGTFDGLPTTLDPDGTISVEYEVVVAADTPTLNTAEVEGEAPDGSSLGDTDPAEIDPRPAGALQIIKTVVRLADACPVPGVDGVGDALEVSIGETVKYCITVTNTGGDTVNITEVADTQAPGGTVAVSPTTLPAGDNATGEYTLEIAADTPEVNTATVTGNGPGAPNLTDSDDAAVDILGAADLEIVKTVVPNDVACPDTFVGGTLGDGDPVTFTVGDTAKYCITIRNGGGDVVSNVAITDDQAPVNAFAGVPTTLAAGDEFDVEYTLEVATDTGPINTANVAGTAPNGDPLSDSDNAVINPVFETADVQIIKSVVAINGTCPATFADALAEDGEGTVLAVATDAEVRYCINVINNGPGPAESLVVTDDQAPNGEVALTNSSLGVNGEATGTYTLVMTTEGRITNTAAVNGVDGNGDALTEDSDIAVVEVAPKPLPLLVIYKSIIPLGDTCPATYDAAVALASNLLTVTEGTEVRYCVNVKNNGEGIATAVSVSDDQAPGGTVTLASSTLAATGDPGDETSGTYTLVPEVPGNENTATASYQDEDGNPQDPVIDVANVVVEPLGDPLIKIRKTVVRATDFCPSTYADAKEGNLEADILGLIEGENAKWCVNVINEGGTDATSVVVTDDQAPNGEIPLDTTTVSANGGEARGSFSLIVDLNTPEVNTATVNGQGPNGALDPDSDPAQIDVSPKDRAVLDIRKTVVAADAACPASHADAEEDIVAENVQTFVAGTTVKYCVNVLNSSDEGTAEGVSVADDQAPGQTVTLNTTTIGPNGEASGSYTLQVTEQTPTVNTATVTGNDPDGSALAPDSDDAEIRVVPPGSPVLEIVKTVVGENDACPPTFAEGTLGEGTALPVSEGGVAKYCITVKNTGLETATNVSVTDSQGTVVLNTTTIGPDGEASGSYTVNVTADTPELNTATASGEGPNGDTVTSEPDTALIEIIPPGKASIGDFVWADSNADGIQDPGELGIGGITVEVYAADASGMPVGDPFVTQTNDEGKWSVTGLDPGDYVVKVVKDADSTFSDPNQTGDADDSDVDPTTGFTAVYNLVEGENDLSADAGIWKPAVLGNLVWFDLNEDGRQDGGDEIVVPGITVEILDENGDKIDEVVTDQNGEWSYLVKPGTYSVRYINSITNSSFTVQQAIGDDLLDSDVDPSNGETRQVTLISDERFPNLDAGIIPPARLGDYVFVDANDNGIQDADEDGLDGVTVQILNADGSLVREVVTANGGLYDSGELVPGDYSVKFILPDGYTFSDPDQGGDDEKDSDAAADGSTPVVTLVGLDENDSIDAGVVPIQPAQLGDTVWSDEDGDGLQGDDEPGIDGVKVRILNADGSLVREVVTANGGKYSSGDLPAGSYIVEFELPAGYSRSPQDVNGNGDDTEDSDADVTTGRTGVIVLEGGENDPTIDAGLIPDPGTATIGSLVFDDLDGDGIQDDDEPGIGGVTVNVWSVKADGTPDEIIHTIETNDDGTWSQLVTEGDYIVQFVKPDGKKFSPKEQGDDPAVDSNPGADGITDIITVVEGIDDPTIDAGLIPTTAIMGSLVFEDQNGDGIQDDDEPGIEGVTVNIWSVKDDGTPDEIVYTVETDEDGNWSQEVPEGDYIVQFVNPDNTKFSPKEEGDDRAVDSNPGDDGITAVVVVVGGTDDPTIDAGIIPLASIGDVIFRDTDKDGIQDAGEGAVSGAEVELFLRNDDGTVTSIGTKTTGSDGEYLFEGLEPGDYYIVVTPPSGFTITDKDAGDDDGKDSDVDPGTGQSDDISVGIGDAIDNVDAGLIPKDPPPPEEKTCEDTNSCPLPYPGPFKLPPAPKPIKPQPLAHTGVESGALATLAIAMMGAGGLLLIGARRSNDDRRED